MKKIIALIVALSFGAGAAFAGCGKKVENVGTFTYNAETKTLTGGDLKKPIAILATTVVKDAAGKKTTIDKLEGKVKIVSEHNKADSVSGVKAKS